MTPLFNTSKEESSNWWVGVKDAIQHPIVGQYWKTKNDLVQ